MMFRRLGFGFRLVHGSIRMLRRRIDRIQFERLGWRGIDHVVVGASRHDHSTPCVDQMFFGPFKDELSSTLFDPDGELIARGPYHEEALTLGEIDFNHLHRTRTRLPLLRDERTALVERELDRILRENGEVNK